MPNIEYFFEDTSFELTNPEAVKKWILESTTNEGFSISNLNFIFCSDEHLHSINVEYLNHDYYTDIITFDNSEDDLTIEGDLFISIDRVLDNSKDHEVPFAKELYRVIIHGVLHLMGYNDKTPVEKTLMREKENAYLSLSQF